MTILMGCWGLFVVFGRIGMMYGPTANNKSVRAAAGLGHVPGPEPGCRDLEDLQDREDRQDLEDLHLQDLEDLQDLQDLDDLQDVDGFPLSLSSFTVLAQVRKSKIIKNRQPLSGCEVRAILKNKLL